MEYCILIDKLTFAYSKDKIFEDFNLRIKRGNWTTIVGPNGGGKSTLMKLLIGELKGEGSIITDGIQFNHKNAIDYYKKVYLLSEMTDDNFISETVKDEIAFVLENKRRSPEEINGKINQIAKRLKINHLLDKNPYHLSGGEKQIVCIAAMLAHEPTVVLLDETLNRIDFEQKNQILKILNELRKEKELTILAITHNLDEAFYADQIIVLDKGRVVLNGTRDEVFQEEKVLNRLGIDVPFMVSLSIKLKHYNLLKEVELNMDEMVAKLWQ